MKIPSCFYGRKKIASDIASGVFGKLAPEVVELVVGAAGQALRRDEHKNQTVFRRWVGIE
jgi:hypothetical protein